MQKPHYRMRIVSDLNEIGAEKWQSLLLATPEVNPFLSFAFLNALHASGSASSQTGWSPCYLTLWHDDDLHAAIPLYVKTHSYGEYVFDWAWAEAYQKNGLEYYPKIVSSIPFTPVAGSRLLGINTAAKQALLNELIHFQRASKLSSTHILFPHEQDTDLLKKAGFHIRHGVQFHWLNQNFNDFDDFLNSLTFKRRKNIRAERKKIEASGINFRHIPGQHITDANWVYFKKCYDLTYSRHFSTPYLNLDFFRAVGATMQSSLHMIVADFQQQDIACSLLFRDQSTVYGRYWGCTEPFPLLHFETAYYQAIDYCIREKIRVFEGGAQGEHKMARGFLPEKTFSAHWLAEEKFSSAIAAYLRREGAGIQHYLNELEERNPYKSEV